MGIKYATREDVKNALDSKETARNNARIDREIDAASRYIEGLCHRKFYPEVDTRYFNWPNNQRAKPWRLWLDQNEVISVTTLTSGGTAIISSDYFLEPANDGPPFTHVEIDLDSRASFNSGDTHQRAIEITGLFGYSADEEPAGELSEALDNSETAVDVSDSGAIGVGDLIKVDSERMVVTGKSMLDTGDTVQTNLDALNSDITVSVADGSLFSVDEVILVDAERMLIVDIAGNDLIVKRAWDGSVLAAHTSTTAVWAPRTLTVQRGVLGTTAVTHTLATSITKHVVPSLVRQLCIAEAINSLQQEMSGYAREIGSGEYAREGTGRGLKDLRDEVYTRYGRQMRMGAV